MSSPQQALVGAGGVGLVLVNMWTTQRHALGPMFDSAATPTQVRPAHEAIKQVGLETLFVAGAVLIAGAGGGAGNAMAALFVVLWVLYLIRHHPTSTGATATTATTSGGIPT